MSALNPDYNKRDCSLPPGCKDLIDVLRLEAALQSKISPAPAWKNWPDAGSDTAPQANLQLVEIGHPVAVKDLAALLGQKPFQIVADLIELAVMANVDQRITFEFAARVAQKYGFVAKRAV